MSNLYIFSYTYRPGNNAPTPERPRFGGGMYSDTVEPEPSPASERSHRQDRGKHDIKSPDSRPDTTRHAIGDGVRKDEVKRGRGRGRGRPTMEVHNYPDIGFCKIRV